MTGDTSLPPDYFERMFAADADPWKFETSDYEKAKYDATLAALNGRIYEEALEIGCANGVLTKRLASTCQALQAIDVSASALAKAAKRCVGLRSVAFAEMTFPRDKPTGSFDLIVMSEVVYYWSAADIVAASGYVQTHLRTGGDCLLVHWIGETDYPQTGDGAVSMIQNALTDFDVVCAERTEKYRLDLWRKR